MRQRILVRSVQRLLPAGERVEEAVHLWQRHRWMAGYAVVAGAALFVVAVVAGFEQLPARLGLAAAGAALAVGSTTRYWVLARTSQGVVLCTSSRIRQYATAIEARLGSTAHYERVSNTLVVSEWVIDGRRYSVARRAEQAMQRIARPAR